MQIEERVFKVNKYIFLKLEGSETIVYVGGEKFQICKSIILNLNLEEINDLTEFHSIDEFAERSIKRIDDNDQSDLINPEVKFWVHSSNLQTWVESKYDTRLLHSNLSFPLLRKLAELGDPIANERIKEEISKRISSGHLSVIKYLFIEGFIDFLSKEEREITFIDLKEIDFSNCNIEKFPNFLQKSKNLEVLDLRHNNISRIPKFINNIKALKKINLSRNKLKSLPDSFADLKLVEDLNLHDNLLYALPKNISSLNHLKNLNLYSNKFSKFPESICAIKSLENLNLSHNKIRDIPPSISYLRKLKYLDLDDNEINKIPNDLNGLKSLKMLSISGNHIEEIPSSCKNLISLTNLYIDDNNLSSIPDFIGDIYTLKELVIDNTQLELMSEDLKRKLSEREVKVGLRSSC
jgi:hypothetical protein